MARKIKFKFNNEEIQASDMAVAKQVSRALVANTMEEAVSLLKRMLQRDIPVMLLGAAGFGKSQILFQAGTSVPGFPVKKENIIDIRAGNMNVEDLRGLPFVDEGAGKEYDKFKTMVTRTSIPDWLKKIILNPDENFILFFDELNHASEHVLNAAYGIILDRQFDDYKFEERTRIVAAGNKPDQNNSVAEISEPLQDRLQIIDIDIATDNDKEFFHSYLRKKYEDVIPKEWLDILFHESTVTSTPRTVERQLKAWVADIEEGETTLTRTGALLPGDYAKIQKLYEKTILTENGAQRHKNTIDKIVAYAKSLEDQKEFFETTGNTWKLGDLVDGKLEATGEGAFVSLSEAGMRKIKDHFSNIDPEMVEAALDMIK